MNDKLLISGESLHFRYYMFIRKHIFNKSLPPKRQDGSFGTSLCPYWQTIIWGSLILVMFSPFCLLGSIVVFVLSYFNVKALQCTRNTFVVVTASTGFVVFTALIVLSFLILLLCAGISIFLEHLWDIPGMLFDSVIFAGASLFLVFCAVGFCIDRAVSLLVYCIDWCIWAVHDYDTLVTILKYAGAGTGLLCVPLALVYMTYRVFSGEHIQRIIEQSKESLAISKPLRDRGQCAKAVQSIGSGMRSVIRSIFSTIFRRKDKGKSSDSLSSLNLLWNVIKAKKQAICPRVDFVQIDSYKKLDIDTSKCSDIRAAFLRHYLGDE